jgi:hypothetical protein
MAGVSLGPLCQDLSNEYVEEKFGAHSLWNPEALRYDRGSSDTIVTVLTVVQIWILEQRCDQCWDYIFIIRLLTPNGLVSCCSMVYSAVGRTWVCCIWEHRTHGRFWMVASSPSWYAGAFGWNMGTACSAVGAI